MVVDRCAGFGGGGSHRCVEPLITAPIGHRVLGELLQAQQLIPFHCPLALSKQLLPQDKSLLALGMRVKGGLTQGELC